jgi:molecular chaperone GrpE
MNERAATPEPEESVQPVSEDPTPSPEETQPSPVGAEATEVPQEEVSEGEDDSREAPDEGETPARSPVHELPFEAENRLLQERLTDLEARLRAVSSAYRDKQREFSEFRERNERLREETNRVLKGEVVTVVFEPVQNLRRSIEAIGRMGVGDEVRQGLAMVFEQFMTALRKLGLEEIRAEGLPFDPGLHEALASMPVPEASLDGKVIQVFDAGYRIGSQVIQPARVVVGTWREPEA